MRLAVLDLGLGSFHLAVFERTNGDEALATRRSWSQTVRLTADAAGTRIGGAALARGLAAAQKLLRDLQAFDSGCATVAIASSALGALENGLELCDEIARRHDLPVELLTGEGEARLSYLGARSQVGADDRLVVADLGQSSLELATGTGSECDLVYSVPLGVDGLRDVYLHPERVLDRTARERVAATVRFGAGDATHAIWNRRPDRMVFTAATAAALAALADELGLIDPGSGGVEPDQPKPSVRRGADEVGGVPRRNRPAERGCAKRPEPLGSAVRANGSGRLGANQLARAGLARLADVLAQFRPIELPALGVDEARSDTIAVGAVVMHTLMELLGFDSAVVSPAGRREGLALLRAGLGASALTDGEFTPPSPDLDRTATGA